MIKASHPVIVVNEIVQAIESSLIEKDVRVIQKNNSRKRFKQIFKTKEGFDR